MFLADKVDSLTRNRLATSSSILEVIFFLEEEKAKLYGQVAWSILYAVGAFEVLQLCNPMIMDVHIA